MHAVAIHGLDGDAASNAQVLAAVLGVTAYEARSRVQVQDGGPAIVATFATQEEGMALAGRLREAGLAALCCAASISASVSSFVVRSFELGNAAFSVATRHGEAQQVQWTQIRHVIRGVATSSTTTRTSIEKKKFSPGRALATGGMMLSKKVKTQQVSTSSSSEAFLIVYTDGAVPISLRESSLDYTSLGDQMRPARAANFLYLVSQFKARAPQALFDVRLMRRAVQQQVLGPSLDTDEYLDLAIALLALSQRVRAAR